MQLIDSLVSQLGVTNEQAEGGAGVLFRFAKEKLSGDDFSQVANVIPGMADLIGKAPEVEAAQGGGGGLLGAIGGAAETLGFGDVADKLGGLAELTGAFDKLNLDAGMIGKFVSLILGFVKESGGDTVESILKGVLK